MMQTLSHSINISTSYFAALSRIPEGYTPISICAKPPSWYGGLQYKKLAPTYDMLMEYKESGDWDRFSKRYINEVLFKFSRYQTVFDLVELANNRNIVLLCFEGKDKKCHRRLVADWLPVEVVEL